jgi:hypothetical protein
MTFKILTDDTLKVIHQSNVRSALNPHAKNLRLDPLEPGNVAMPIVKSGHIQFVCSVNDDNYEEILSYNQLMDYSEKDEQQHQDKTVTDSGTSSILSATKVLLELPIQNTRVLDTTFSLSGRMGRSGLNLSISLARMIQ